MWKTSAQGMLEDIMHNAAVEVHKVDIKIEIPSVEEEEEKSKGAKKSCKFIIKGEYQETGGVKWMIYESYLKASYVVFSFFSWLVFFLPTDSECLGRIGFGCSLRFWWLWFRD